ncbi:hypothetical protein Emag_000788 [Eimeria magna]
MDDVDLLSARGPVVSELLQKAPVRLVQFTGITTVAAAAVAAAAVAAHAVAAAAVAAAAVAAAAVAAVALFSARDTTIFVVWSSKVASELSVLMEGRVKVEDGGFNWKILCGDVDPQDADYIAWQSDQDAYALSGQKCSAQSLLLVHRNWVALGLLKKLREQAARRRVEDLTISPLLSLTNEDIQAHVNVCTKAALVVTALMELPGSRLLFGGKPVEGFKPPEGFGLFQPTAIQLPLKLLLEDENARKLATTEVFGPLQVIVEWADGDEASVASLTQQLPHHLTAAVVSRAAHTLQFFLQASGNGTTYAGIRARTTGAPQNHSFGPGGDPRGASIGFRACYFRGFRGLQEIILDQGPIPQGWSLPPPS